MLSSSFLSLLKEEPSEDSSMDTNNGHMPIPRSGPHPPTVVNDPQMHGLPISSLTPAGMQPLGIVRGDMDPNFEPIARGRSNTWPLLPEGLMESEESSGVDATTSTDSQRVQGSSIPLESSSGGPPKKNTSRRNPWGNMSYADLIAQAIVSSPDGRATLSQIYDWMVQNVPYFKDKGDSNSSAGWKNSIRHNLSLHNRFMRMQNEGTGKSSWWVLNPDAKPGKSTRRRANTLEGSRIEKKRGRVRKKADGLRNSIDAPSSPNLGGEGLEYFPGSPNAAALHHPFQLSPQDYRPRASSNASSCGRLSPIPAIEADMHDSQVPPMSPGVVGWSTDYWSPSNHAHSSHQSHMGRHLHEPYTDHLVESIGEGLKLGPREPWVPPHGLGSHGASSDCLKIPHHHMNGYIPHSHNQHSPGFGSYDDYRGFVSANSHCGAFSHAPAKEKPNIRRPQFLPFHIPPLQQISPTPNSHNVSPTAAIGESHFSPPSCEQDIRSTPSFSSPTHNTSTNHHTPPSIHHHQASSNPQESCVEATLTTTPPVSSTNPHSQHPSSESTTMLRVALSHRETTACSINGVPHYKQNGVGQLHPIHPVTGANDIVDLDSIQGGLECNVEEVIKHELQYEDHLNFDFQHGQPPSTYSHPHMYPHREGSGPPIGASSGPVQVYSCSSIPSGNQWVR